MNLQYFCYSDTRQYSEYLAVCELSDMSEYLFIKDIFPKVQAFYLYDMNEISYLFWKLLIRIKFPVRTISNEWKIGGAADIPVVDYPKCSRYDLYS